MKDREYHIGPGAVSLLLVIVVVSMSVLGLLALISARSDYKLTERSMAFAAAEHTASANAQASVACVDEILASCAAQAADDDAYLAAIQASLPQNMRLEGRIIGWEEHVEGGRTLFCEVEVLPLGNESRFAWNLHTFIAELS
ncbi:MAG: hypothetical protein J6M10_06325 [Clostridia bacterium]|nr:hypothetical protein [Clostridia bacterium]